MNNLRILIVDDDKITTDILSSMLNDESREIVICHGAKEALAAFQTSSFDIILSDINMPEMNGLEMIREIRKSNKSVKIAIFTNFDNKQYMLDAITFGVNQFFSKPFQKEHLLNVIDNLTREIVDKRKTEAALNRQQNILHAIKEMSEKFLQHDDWNETLYEQMKLLKDAAEASSIFIYRNQNIKNPVVAERYLSINDNYEAFTPNLLHYQELRLLKWKKALSGGGYVNGTIKSLNAKEQMMLRSCKVETLLMLPVFADGEWWGFLGIGHDRELLFDLSNLEMLETVARIIGSAINNQQNLREHEIKSAMFEYTVDGIVITDAENRIININNAFSDITGFTREEVVGKNPTILKSSAHDRSFYQSMWEKIQHEGYWQGEIKNRRKNDELYIEWLSITCIKDKKGNVQNYMGIFSDVTAHRKSQLEYAHLATHDALTGLANRLLLDDRLTQAINHAKRFDKNVAVIFCDLDNFKPINDVYGHTVGDLALKRCSDYFTSIVRAEDTVCRYGGDEFVIILGDIDKFSDTTAAIEKILNIADAPFSINGDLITLEMSAGISFYPQDALDAKDLIDKADEAMYSAKRNGKNAINYYGRKPLFLDQPDLSIYNSDFSI
ncbi:diguanylate cyclase [Sulfurimonas sp. HSL3-7]|uniref:two-component system response regulator n=1 Tax=Sulfonitrofixus jiaomeiensis TaxID=3131938 RepID=UPI0031F743BA